MESEGPKDESHIGHVYVSVCVCVRTCSVLSDSLQPNGL